MEVAICDFDLSNCDSDGFLHWFRLGESVFDNPDSCASGGVDGRDKADGCVSVFLRRILKCDISDKSRACDFAWTYGGKLYKVAEMDDQASSSHVYVVSGYLIGRGSDWLQAVLNGLSAVSSVFGMWDLIDKYKLACLQAKNPQDFLYYFMEAI